MKNGPYTLIVAPKNYPGKKYRNRYVYEHHFNWWKYRKQLVPKGYAIHHKDGDHKNNNIANLQLVTKKQHSALHGEIRSLKALERVVCGMCSNFFVLMKSKIKTRLGRNKYNKVFCGRKCGRKHQYIMADSNQGECAPLLLANEVRSIRARPAR